MAWPISRIIALPRSWLMIFWMLPQENQRLDVTALGWVLPMCSPGWVKKRPMMNCKLFAYTRLLFLMEKWGVSSTVHHRWPGWAVDTCPSLEVPFDQPFGLWDWFFSMIVDGSITWGLLVCDLRICSTSPSFACGETISVSSQCNYTNRSVLIEVFGSCFARLALNFDIFQDTSISVGDRWVVSGPLMTKSVRKLNYTTRNQSRWKIGMCWI